MSQIDTFEDLRTALASLAGDEYFSDFFKSATSGF